MPEADPLIGELRELSTPSGEQGMLAHATLIAPFAHARELTLEREQDLAVVFDGFAPFDITLTAVERFDDIDVVYLKPEPREPFIELIEAVFAREPEYPPYGGAAEHVVPHVTVGYGAKLPAGTEERLGADLPLGSRAERVTLVERGDDLRWRTRTEFPLAAV